MKSLAKSLITFGSTGLLLCSLHTNAAETAVSSSKFDFEQLTVVSDQKIEKAPSMNSEDPFESFNREMLSFNLAFHRSIGKPLVKGYNQIPIPLRNYAENFLSNLNLPLSMINSFLQGNVEDGLTTFMRFSVNSTFGFVGLLDIASAMGLQEIKEDFGQTLYVWGFWTEASYLVLPILGPTTTRDLFGRTEGFTDPIYFNHRYQSFGLMDHNDNKLAMFVADGFITYAKAAPLIDQLENQIDPYILSRESYLQYRENQIYNGNPPMPKLDDDFLFQ